MKNDNPLENRKTSTALHQQQVTIDFFLLKRQKNSIKQNATRKCSPRLYAPSHESQCQISTTYQEALCQ